MLAYLYLSINIYPSIYLPTLSICLLISVCPSIHSSIYLVYLFICLSIHPPSYAVYLSVNLCVLSLRKKPIFKFMPPFSLHLSLTFYRKWNTVADSPMDPSSQSIVKLMCQHILSLFLSLCCAAQLVGAYLPDQRLNLGLQQWESGVLTTGLPRNSHLFLFFWKNKNKEKYRKV